MIFRHAEQYLKAIRPEGLTLMRGAVVIEKADGNYSAHVPDLPGCIATGNTVAAVENEIREAIRFQIDGFQADGFAGSAADQHRRIPRDVKPSEWLDNSASIPPVKFERCAERLIETFLRQHCPQARGQQWLRKT